MAGASQIKVLHIASGDLWAGAEAQLLTVATALQNIPSVNVSVVLLNYGNLEQKLRDAGVEVSVIDESELNGFQILRQLTNKIRKIKPDVIHTHRSKENILGSIAARLCGNIPSLRTAHGASEHRPPWYHIPKRLIIFMDWFCGCYLQHKIIAVSEDLAGILQRNFPPEKIIVIENGINAALLARSFKHTQANTAPSEAHLKIGIAGRLVPVKRVDLFIKAAAELLKTHPELNTSFHIFGDGPLRTELIALNKKLNTENMIHFEGHCESLQQELVNLDIFLITSDHEGLPMILLEAMALKIPVIAHAVGGIPTALKQGECGFLVTEHQPSAYADAIFTLINNPVIRANFIQNALNRVTTYYSSEKNAAAYHNAYRGFCVINNAGAK